MLKKTRYLIPFFFVLLIISSLFMNSAVGAIPKYNHILNPSFALYENFIEDGSFESGAFEMGVQYGNFSIAVGTPDIKAWDYRKSGVYSLYYIVDGEAVFYNLTSYYWVYGADVESFSFWMNCTVGGTGKFYVDFIYTDNSTTIFDINVTINELVYYQLDISNLEGGSIIWSVRLRSVGNTGKWVDNIQFMVDTGSNSQDEITLTSSPWFLGQTPDSPFGHINEVLGYTDNTSVQMDTAYFPRNIVQNIGYLDSDSIEYIDLWVHGADNALGEGVIMDLVYSDRSVSSKSEVALGNGSIWENLNFGHSWINPNKYVVQILIRAMGSSQAFNIDDVGIWSTLKLNTRRFSFSITPNPISVGVFNFEAYQGISYTMHCYIWDDDNLLTENGTYIIDDKLGVYQGSFTNGTLTHELSSRSGVVGFYEQITFVFIMGDGVEIMEFEITAWWEYAPDEPPIVDEDYIQPWIGTQAGTNFMVMMFMVFVPSMILGLEFNQRRGSGLLGFMIGLAIMSSIAYLSGFMPLWFLFVMVIAFVVFILHSLRGGL